MAMAPKKKKPAAKPASSAKPAFGSAAWQAKYGKGKKKSK